MAGEKAGWWLQTQECVWILDKEQDKIRAIHYRNPGIKDFRDQSFWYNLQSKNGAILAVKDHIKFSYKKDLKSWTKSEFRKTIGTHGGVWECLTYFHSK
jgi:sucrose-6-phosphate hydrolase SacC (GH32 family)